MSLTEPTFWDLPVSALPARADDPETSKASAVQLDVRQRQGEVLRALRHRVVSSTAEQVQDTLRAWNMHRDKADIRSRLSELKDPKRWPDQQPLVKKVGVRKSATGRNTATWVLTARGAEIARGLDL